MIQVHPWLNTVTPCPFVNPLIRTQTLQTSPPQECPSPRLHPCPQSCGCVPKVHLQDLTYLTKVWRICRVPIWKRWSPGRPRSGPEVRQLPINAWTYLTELLNAKTEVKIMIRPRRSWAGGKNCKDFINPMICCQNSQFLWKILGKYHISWLQGNGFVGWFYSWWNTVRAR